MGQTKRASAVFCSLKRQLADGTAKNSGDAPNSIGYNSARFSIGIPVAGIAAGLCLLANKRTTETKGGFVP